MFDDDSWIPGFVSGDMPVIEKLGNSYDTREQAAEAAEAIAEPHKQLLVMHERGARAVIFEATRSATGWEFERFPNAARQTAESL
jgi:hypothetical protein